MKDVDPPAADHGDGWDPVEFLDRLAPYRKAIVAFVVPGLVALGAALADGRVTAVEVVGVLVAALGSSGAVYAVPNTAPPSSSSTGSTSSTPPTGGVPL